MVNYGFQVSSSNNSPPFWTPLSLHASIIVRFLLLYVTIVQHWFSPLFLQFEEARILPRPLCYCRFVVTFFPLFYISMSLCFSLHFIVLHHASLLCFCHIFQQQVQILHLITTWMILSMKLYKKIETKNVGKF